MGKKPYILVVNDDGVEANGIKELVDCVRDIGEILVVAPSYPRSGQSSAFTVFDPLRIKKIKIEEDLTVYSCSGTPADCVKVAMHELATRPIDLMISGINHGSNTSISVVYSGTVGSVLDACITGIDSIAFSLCDFNSKANFSFMKPFVSEIVKSVLQNKLPKGICLNVNFPAVENIKGIKVCRQAKGHWEEGLLRRTDQFNRKYYWLTGEYLNEEPEATDTDEYWISKDYGTIVPVTVDMTAYAFLDKFKDLEK